jgi:hypothetical protein
LERSADLEVSVDMTTRASDGTTMAMMMSSINSVLSFLMWNRRLKDLRGVVIEDSP